MLMLCWVLPAGKTLTEDCKAELADFKIELGESINKNLPLGEQLLHPPLCLMSLLGCRSGPQVSHGVSCACSHRVQGGRHEAVRGPGPHRPRRRPGLPAVRMMS